MSNFKKHLYYLLKKNFLMKIRDKKTLIEIFLPLILTFCVIFFKNFGNSHHSSVIDQPIIETLNLDKFFLKKSFLLYAPGPFDSNSDVEKIMDNLRLASGIFQNYIIPQTDSKSIENFYRNNQSFFSGIFFPSVDENGFFKSSQVPVEIRFPSDKLPSTKNTFLTENWQTNTNCELYNNYGFITLQSIISMGIQDIFRSKNNSNINSHNKFNSFIQRFPQKAYDINNISYINGLYLFISIMILGVYAVQFIVKEKENMNKENMKVMGVNAAAIWVSYFLIYFIIILLVSFFMTLIIVVGNLIPSGYFFEVFLLILFFGCSFLGFVLITSVFFRNPTLASQIFTIYVFILFLPSFFIHDINNLTSVQWFFTCIDSPFCFTNEISNYSYGLPSPHGHISYILMMLFDTFLFLILAIYLEMVVPQSGSAYLPWYFCCKCLKKTKSINSNKYDILHDSKSNNGDIEPIIPSDQIQEVIKISDLQKKFNSLIAVDSLNLSIYSSQILALLGHNGAGKTTTLQMLTGFLMPTSGSIYYQDIDITQDYSIIRNNLGVCPQQNIIFNFLTVNEHLEFFAAIKNVPEYEIQTEINTVLGYLGLENLANSKVEIMSGGEKRKLTLAISIIGNSKILLLDGFFLFFSLIIPEPTSGMDPQSRRKVWNLLQTLKKSRVIVLTTHYMEEADILADRIAILSHGKLRCFGSSLFLKSRFGIGYHLFFEILQDSQVEKISSLVNSKITGSQLINNNNNVLEFTLPLSQTPFFYDLFSSLASSQHLLKFTHFSVELSSLEEVFLNLADEYDENKDNVNPYYNMDSKKSIIEEKITDINESIQPLLNPSETDKIIGIDQLPSLSDPYVIYNDSYQQIRGTFFKRFHMVKRDKQYIWLAIYSVVMTIIMIFMLQSIFVKSSDHPLNLNNASLFAHNIMDYTASADISNAHSLMEKFQTTNKFFQSDNDMIQSLFNDPTLKYSALNFLSVKPQSGELSTILLYNSSSLHAIPSTYNILINSFARLQNISVNIDFISHPVKSDNDDLYNIYIYQAFTMSLGMFICYLATGFGIHSIREKATKVKQLQLIMGLNPLSYWIGNFLIDYIIYLFLALLLIITYLIFNIQCFLGYNIFGTIVVFFCFGLSFIPFNYFLTHFFSTPQKFQILIVFFSIALSIILYFTALYLDHFYLFVLFAIFPFFNLLFCLYKLAQNFILIYTLQHFCIFSCDQPSYSMVFSFDTLGVYLIIFVSTGFLYFFLAVFFDSSLFYQVFRYFHSPLLVNNNDSNQGDDDVIYERNSVNTMSLNDAPLIIKNLKKVFPSSNSNSETKVAVNNLSLSVLSNQFIGLLGPNGAGKSTILKMLIGDLLPDSGSIYYNGEDFFENTARIFPMFGYCPQEDGLVETLTCSEHFALFSRIKKIPENIIPSFIEKILDIFHMQEYANNTVATLSGGNKRKLSSAIALIGQSPILFFDEPTSGIDPQNKRTLLDIYKKIVDRVFILTTHNMEEADYLCSCITILINGCLVCMGSGQHLKNKYGKDYCIRINTKNDENINVVKQLMSNNFPSSTLTEEFSCNFVYSIPSSDVSLSSFFLLFESSKEKLQIVDYSISQPSLEQIFIQFAREQKEIDVHSTQ